MHYPDRYKYKFAPGDYVVAICSHMFGESVRIEKGQTYRVLKYYEADKDPPGFDGVILEEFSGRSLPMLASRFVPTTINQMPDNRRYYKALTEDVS